MPGAAGVPGAADAAAVAAAGVPGAPGAPGAALGPGGAAEDPGLKAVIEALQAVKLELDVVKDKHKKDKKKDKKKKKKKSSSSSSSRSRSSSSSSDGKDRFLHWVPKGGKDVDCTVKQHQKMATMKFKKRADLIAFQAGHPGSLAAAFLAKVRENMMKSPGENTRDLRHVSVTTWSLDPAKTGLKETRDQREVQTLAQILDAINKSDLPRAADLVAQRIKAVQRAKDGKGTGEKAALLELLPTMSTSSALEGEIALSQ